MENSKTLLREILYDHKAALIECRTLKIYATTFKFVFQILDRASIILIPIGYFWKKNEKIIINKVGIQYKHTLSSLYTLPRCMSARFATKNTH